MTGAPKTGSDSTQWRRDATNAGSATPAGSAGAKALLRQTLRATRRALDANTRAHWDRVIGARILAWWQGARAPLLAVYWPLADEPDLAASYAQLAGWGVQLVLPVVLNRDAQLAFAEWVPGEPMAKDVMGIAVPAKLRFAARVPPAVVIPCLGFNQGRFRLGYGGGFYDRTLERLPRPITIGVAYSCLAAQFDSAPHDIALDYIFTEA